MTQSNAKIAEVGKNAREKEALIWNIANSLFGAFKPHEYGLVILPMAIIKRFHDCLLPTLDAVWAQDEKLKTMPSEGLIVIRYYLALRGAENGVTVMVTPFFCVQG